MRTHLIISAVGMLAVLGIVSVALADDLPAHHSDATPVLPPAKVRPDAPLPGVYSARPFSMLVVVPKATDTQMAIAVRNNFASKMPSIKPETRLEKR